MTHALATATLAAALLAGCGADPEPRIAVLLAERPDADDAGAELAELRAKLRTVDDAALIATAPDAATREAHVERALAAGIKVLVVEPLDADASAALVEHAHERGVLVISYDRLIRSDALDVHVGHDDYRAGVLEAEGALRATSGRGRFLLVGADTATDDAADNVLRGAQHTLAPYISRGDVHVTLRRTHDLTGAAEFDAILTPSGACAHRQAIDIVRDRVALARAAADVATQLLREGRVGRDLEVIKLGGSYVPAVSVGVEAITRALPRRPQSDPSHGRDVCPTSEN